jgi:hypothetical protein
MKRILILFLLTISLAGHSQTLNLPNSVKVLNPKPLDAWYYNSNGLPYVDAAAVLSNIGTVRHEGQRFRVGNTDYCFEGGIADVDLVPCGGGGGSGISKAGNGLSIVSGDSVVFNGGNININTLTEIHFTDTTSGFLFEQDYDMAYGRSYFSIGKFADGLSDQGRLGVYYYGQSNRPSNEESTTINMSPNGFIYSSSKNGGVDGIGYGGFGYDGFSFYNAINFITTYRDSLHILVGGYHPDWEGIKYDTLAFINNNYKPMSLVPKHKVEEIASGAIYGALPNLSYSGLTYSDGLLLGGTLSYDAVISGDEDIYGPVKFKLLEIDSIELDANNLKITRLAAPPTETYALVIDDAGSVTSQAITSGGSEFADNVFRINDNTDPTKQIAFEASGITAATTRTLTVPNASGTIALTDAVWTFSNLQNISSGSVLYRKSGGTGVIEEQSLSTLKTDLNLGLDFLEKTFTDDQFLQGDGHSIFAYDITEFNVVADTLIFLQSPAIRLLADTIRLPNLTANRLLVTDSNNDLRTLTIGSSQLAGRGSSGEVGAITLGTNLSMSGSTLNSSIPDVVIEDVTTTTYEFVEADKNKIKRFTHASGCTANIPTGLPSNWFTTIYRGSGAGVTTVTTGGTLEAAGNTLDTENTMGYIYNRGSSIYILAGAVGTTGGSVATLNDVGDVTITSNSSGEILKWDGTAWINNTLAEAGIQAAGSYLTGNQTITLSGDVTGSGATSISTTIASGAVDIAMLSATGTPSASTYLRGDNTWATVSGGSTTQSKTLVLNNPSASENISLFYTDVAVTISKVADAVQGSTPSVTYQVNHASARNSGSPNTLYSVGRAVTSAAGTTTTTFNDATIPAGSYVWFTTSAASGTVGDFMVTLTYTND